MTTDQRRRRRFTEAFRKEQVELIESGKATQAEIARRYEVRPYSVLRWVNKYGKLNRKLGLTTIGSSKDFDRLTEIEKDYKALQILFGEQQIQLIRLQKLLDIAKAELGGDFEKKVDSYY